MALWCPRLVGIMKDPVYLTGTHLTEGLRAVGGQIDNPRDFNGAKSEKLFGAFWAQRVGLWSFNCFGRVRSIKRDV
jgi:hypothetical protein